MDNDGLSFENLSFGDYPPGSPSPASPSASIKTWYESEEGALVRRELETVRDNLMARVHELTIMWASPSWNVATEALEVSRPSNDDVHAQVQAAIVVQEKKQKEQDRKHKAQSDVGGWGQPQAPRSATFGGGWGQAPAQFAVVPWSAQNNSAPSVGKGSKGGKGKGKGKGKGSHQYQPAPPASQPPASFNGMESRSWPQDNQLAVPQQAFSGGGLTNDQCAYCKQEGHWKNDCPNRQWDNWKGSDWY